MELLETDLSKIRSIIEYDDWVKKINLSKKILAGLNYLHDENILHLDIKPANILLSNDLSKVKLVDFGLSSTSTNSVSFINHQGGTPNYMSPEQIENNIASTKSDIYAFGGVLFFLCTYKDPYLKLIFMQIYDKLMKKEIQVTIYLLQQTWYQIHIQWIVWPGV